MYIAKINISKERKNAIDRLLSIENLEESDYGYQNEFENIVYYIFENGAKLYIDLCSGENNYFLQYQLFNKNDYLIEEDCMFDLEELENIEDSDNNDIYSINFVFN